MTEFLNTALSFPTSVFTLFLGVCVVLWLLTALGLFDFDIGADVDADIDIDIELGDAGSGIGDMAGVDLPDHPLYQTASASEVLGFLSRFGLNGVPITLVITFLSLFGWLIAFQTQAWLLNPISVKLIYYPLGAVVMVTAFVISVFITAQVCKPLRKIFKQTYATSKKHLIGQVAVVRSTRVNANFGEALMDDGGAGLLLKIRAPESAGFKTGDRVVLLEYKADQGVYNVISEEEFKGFGAVVDKEFKYHTKTSMF